MKGRLRQTSWVQHFTDIKLINKCYVPAVVNEYAIMPNRPCIASTIYLMFHCSLDNDGGIPFKPIEILYTSC